MIHGFKPVKDRTDSRLWIKPFHLDQSRNVKLSIFEDGA